VAGGGKLQRGLGRPGDGGCLAPQRPGVRGPRSVAGHQVGQPGHHPPHQPGRAVFRHRQRLQPLAGLARLGHVTLDQGHLGGLAQQQCGLAGVGAGDRGGGVGQQEVRLDR